MDVMFFMQDELQKCYEIECGIPHSSDASWKTEYQITFVILFMVYNNIVETPKLWPAHSILQCSGQTVSYSKVAQSKKCAARPNATSPFRQFANLKKYCRPSFTGFHTCLKMRIVNVSDLHNFLSHFQNPDGQITVTGVTIEIFHL